MVMRFTPRGKAKLMKAIEEGKISQEQAREQFALSPEELDEWRRGYESKGLRGLKTRKERPSERRWYLGKVD